MPDPEGKEPVPSPPQIAGRGALCGATAGTHVRPAAVVREMVEAAGFVAPQVTSAAYAAEIETPEEFWDLQVTFSSFARKRIEAARLDQVEDLNCRFLSRCRDLKRLGGSLIYPYSAFIVSATRP